MKDRDPNRPDTPFAGTRVRRTRVELALPGPMSHRSGHTWRVPEYALPTGVRSLPVGEVIGVTDGTGRREKFLIEAAVRDLDVRVYYFVLLGGEVDVRDAQAVLVALEHVGTTGCEFILMVNGNPMAKLSPLDVDD